MNLVATLILTAAAASAASPAGAPTAAAQVTVTIVRPVAVRQGSGVVEQAENAPRYQLSRRDGVVLIEFQ